MRSIDILVAEHDHIWLMLDKLDAKAADLTAGSSVPADFLSRALDFIARYADQCHHAKEEDLLFPLLSEKGIPVEGGPIGAMLEEHGTARQLVRSFRESVARYGAGDTSVGPAMAEALRAYTALLRQHILKENEVLFPMAESVLSVQEDLSLAQQFESADAEHMGAEKRRWEEWVTSL